jgi:hypothetical protein
MSKRRNKTFVFTSAQEEFAAGVISSADNAGIRQTRLPQTPFNETVQEARDKFVKATLDQFSWLTTADGKAELDEKEKDLSGAAASMITNILHFAAAAGASPMQILEIATDRFSTELDENSEFGLVSEFAEQLLEIAEAVAES